MINNLKIAIDGSAATGKSTVAKRVSEILKLRCINSGLIYRFIAYTWINLHNITDFNILESDISKDDINELFIKIQEYVINFDDKSNFIVTELKDNKNLNINTSKYKTSIVSHYSSILSSFKEIRNLVTTILINISKNGNIIMEGRDIGTIVLPSANLKFFLEVSPDVAFERRKKELETLLKDKIDNLNHEKYIKDRDNRDLNRNIAPLKKANDSIVINTSSLSIDEVVKLILDYVQKL